MCTLETFYEQNKGKARLKMPVKISTFFVDKFLSMKQGYYVICKFM